MALTRAQLLAGNQSQGTVLAGQVQGVTQGAGILIASDGTISVDASTVIGLMKLNNASAYNSYVWPGTAGSDGQQLRTDGTGNLSWFDPDSIPWTAKGELVVGTGANTEALLTVGPNGSILIADSTTTTGLAYTSNYVTTTGSTGAAALPAGSTIQRPGVPVAGQIRFNSQDSDIEFYDGSNWISVIASGAVTYGLGLVFDGTTVKASTPIQFGSPAAGSAPTGAVDGSLYWDDNLGVMFIRYNDGDSTQWVQVVPSGGGGGGGTAGVSQIVAGAGISISPAGGTGAVTITATGGGGGVSSVSVTSPITNTGTAANPNIGISSATTTSTGAIQLATAAEAAAGTSTVKAITPSISVPKVLADMTGAAIIPGGDDAERAVITTPTTGMFRYNDQNGTPASMEYYDGAAWTGLATGPSTGFEVFAILQYNTVAGDRTTFSYTKGYNVAATTIGVTGLVRITFTNPVPAGKRVSIDGIPPTAQSGSGARVFYDSWNLQNPNELSFSNFYTPGASNGVNIDPAIIVYTF